MQRLPTLLRMSLVSLYSHRRRTLLLGLAITSVTVVSMLLNGFGHGVRASMIRTATTLVSGHLNVAGFYKVTPGRATAAVTRYEAVLETVRKAVPQMTYVRQRSRGVARVISEQDVLHVGVLGVDVVSDPEFSTTLQIRSGNVAELARPNTILLFEEQATRLGIKVNDVVTLLGETTRGATNTVDCRVAAIASDTGLFSRFGVFVPNQTARTLFGWRADVTGAIEIFLPARELPRVDEIAARLRSALEAAGYRVREGDGTAAATKAEAVLRENWIGQQLDVTSWEDELSFFTWILRALQGLTAVLTIVMLGVVVLGITNAMWISVRERTREIGTLRAIGMRRGDVLLVFVLEALLLGLAGTVAGAVLGVTVATALNMIGIPLPMALELFVMSRHLHVSLQADSALTSIAIISAVCALASILPARRAAGLGPISAMSNFG